MALGQLAGGVGSMHGGDGGLRWVGLVVGGGIGSAGGVGSVVVALVSD